MTQAKKIDDLKPAAALPPLSNIIFQALATRQAGFSQTAGKARRFLPEIGPLAGFSEPRGECKKLYTFPNLCWCAGVPDLAAFFDTLAK
jgi:hypothetical protein